MARRPCLLFALSMVSAAALSGCQSNVKGSWACAIDRGGVCSSITDIDHSTPSNASRASSAKADVDPVVAGAIPARLWQDAAWSAGPIAGAPIHENDQLLKVAVAPWVDGAGDYHAGSEVYAVMRRGGWYVAPRDTVRRVELLGAPIIPPPPPNPVAGADTKPSSTPVAATAAPSPAPPSPVTPTASSQTSLPSRAHKRHGSKPTRLASTPSAQAANSPAHQPAS